MDITFTGVIIEVSPIKQGTSKRDGKPWAMQEYVIEEVNQRYPSRCIFQVFGQNRIQELAIGQGEMITAHLGISANKTQDGRWFNKLDCWKVDRYNNRQTYIPQDEQNQSVFPEPNNDAGSEAAPQAPNDGLPF